MIGLKKNYEPGGVLVRVYAAQDEVFKDPSAKLDVTCEICHEITPEKI
jgi:hypothetical protein